MKKVAVLSVGDYRHITLISKYTSYFDSHNICYDVICTDRYDDKSNRDHVIQYVFRNENSKVGKIKAFLVFHRWASKIIIDNGYDADDFVSFLGISAFIISSFILFFCDFL